jgi:hypothetical protein
MRIDELELDVVGVAGFVADLGSKASSKLKHANPCLHITLPWCLLARSLRTLLLNSVEK